MIGFFIYFKNFLLFLVLMNCGFLTNLLLALFVGYYKITSNLTDDIDGDEEYIELTVMNNTTGLFFIILCELI